MNRALTGQEEELLAWLLKHGNDRALSHLESIPHVRVIAHCPCGCASIDFAVNGNTPTEHGMEIVSDYLWQSEAGAQNGVFVFLKQNHLAGLEVWSHDGAETPGLPRIDMLRTYEEGSNDQDSSSDA